MAEAKVPLTFRIYKGEQIVREETLTQPVIKVGKLSSSHLRLDDDTVSRMHAVIEVSGPNDISIIDLGSTKGTIVNGQKVNKAKLQDGDLIQLGDTRIELGIVAAGANVDAGEPEDEVPTRVNTPTVSPGTGEQDVISSVPHPVPAPAPAPAAAPPPAAPAPRAARPSPPPAPAPPAPPAYAAPPRAAAPPPAAYGNPMTGSSSFGDGIIDDVGGGRAIEVAAMLDDSVIAVKHVMNPRGGQVTGTTWAMFGIGALLFLLAAIGFARGVSNAEFNRKAQELWVDGDAGQGLKPRPLVEFRPRRISLGYDWMAFGGLAGGLVLMTLGLVRYRNERQSPWFRIGHDAEVEFPTADAPSGAFPLVGPLGDDFVFNFTDRMDGDLIVDGRSTPLGQLASQGLASGSILAPGALQAQIPLKGRYRVRSGRTTYLVSSVPAPRRHAIPLFATLESGVLAFFAGSALVHLAFLMLLFSIPPSPKTLSLDVLGGDGRLSRVQATPPEDPKNEEQLTEDKGDDKSGGTGTKMALEEGKMGKKDSTRQSGQYAMKKNWEGDPQLARQQAMDAARRSGVLGAFSAQPGGAFASITGTGDFSSGIDNRDVYGGLIGNEVGEMQGGWGYGLKGTGPGGGGTGWGTIGTGRYGTIGHGSGTGSGYGVGSGRGGMRGRKASAPDVRIGNATSTGNLDKNIIRRYIRQKLPQIKYCYEKQLLVKPSLTGTVVTQFTISGNGAVISVSAGGIGDKDVESCVAATIKTIQFPKPKGGGLVNVRYPFTFRPAGQ